MYSDKFIHKKIQCEGGRYITIGDPYKDTDKAVPERWKKKQLSVPCNPENAGGGYFGLMGRPFIYVPDRYAAQVPYAKSQPFEQRRLGFGSHDASKRDEFTHRIRADQYRELLKRDKRLLVQPQIPPILEKDDEAYELRKKAGLEEPKHLYDIGKTRETPFNPKVSRDAFYDGRMTRRGPYRTASQDVGDHSFSSIKQEERFGKNHSTNAFYSKGHIGDT